MVHDGFRQYLQACPHVAQFYQSGLRFGIRYLCLFTTDHEPLDAM